jgi:hypothetical protein
MPWWAPLAGLTGAVVFASLAFIGSEPDQLMG